MYVGTIHVICSMNLSALTKLLGARYEAEMLEQSLLFRPAYLLEKNSNFCLNIIHIPLIFMNNIIFVTLPAHILLLHPSQYVLWSLELASEVFHEFFVYDFGTGRLGFSSHCISYNGKIPKRVRSRLERKLELPNLIWSRRTRILV